MIPKSELNEASNLPLPSNPENPPLQIIEEVLIDDVTRLLKPYMKSPEFKFSYCNEKNATFLPRLIPYENKFVKIKKYHMPFLCEEFECTTDISPEDFLQIWQKVKKLGENELIIKHNFYSFTSKPLTKGSRIAFYSQFADRTNIRCKIATLDKKYPDVNELHGLFIQLKYAIDVLFSSELYEIDYKTLKADMFFLPILSPSCIYVYGKGDYKLGLSTAYKFGDFGIEKFICPEIKTENGEYILPGHCIIKSKEAFDLLAYSIGTFFNDFYLKKYENVANNHLQSKSNNPLKENLIDKITKMIEERNYEYFGDYHLPNIKDQIKYYNQIFDYTIYYNLIELSTQSSNSTRQATKGNSLEEEINSGQNGKLAYKAVEQMEKFIEFIKTLSENTKSRKGPGSSTIDDKFKISKDTSKSNNDAGYYKLAITVEQDLLIIPPNTNQNSSDLPSLKKWINADIHMLFKKGCMAVKTSIDNLNLVDGFSDDLQHLASTISNNLNYLNAEIDEKLQIVFRMAYTFTHFENLFDQLIDTIDTLTITAIIVLKHLVEYQKTMAYGKIARTSEKILKEIKEKISLYNDFKAENGQAIHLKMLHGSYIHL